MYSGPPDRLLFVDANWFRSFKKTWSCSKLVSLSNLTKSQHSSKFLINTKFLESNFSLCSLYLPSHYFTLSSFFIFCKGLDK